MNRSLRLRLPVVAAAVTASLVAAGCGSSGSGGSGGGAAASVPGITKTQILIGGHHPPTVERCRGAQGRSRRHPAGEPNQPG